MGPVTFNPTCKPTSNPPLLALLAAFAGISVPAQPQAAVELVTTKQAIPKNFKTYSLFLVCNPQWLDPAKNAGLLQLYRQFQSFGRAIGDDHAAVWFWKSNSYEHSDAALAQIVDVERSVRFCQAWKLKPSEGPHLVITGTYPDEAHLSTGLPEDSAVYKLGDMAPPDISALLAKLTDQLIASGKVDHPDSPRAPLPPAKLWVQLLAATQQMINSFGCAWSFKINAGPVSADLKSCKTS
jgi:hypothetical protein